MKTTNSIQTLIALAGDPVAERGIVSPEKAENPSIASRTYRMVALQRYTFTSDDAIFSVWADCKAISETDRPAAREQFVSKGQTCSRASGLGKEYGWGSTTTKRVGSRLMGLKQTPIKGSRPVVTSQ